MFVLSKIIKENKFSNKFSKHQPLKGNYYKGMLRAPSPLCVIIETSIFKIFTNPFKNIFKTSNKKLQKKKKTSIIWSFSKEKGPLIGNLIILNQSKKISRKVYMHWKKWRHIFYIKSSVFFKYIFYNIFCIYKLSHTRTHTHIHSSRNWSAIADSLLKRFYSEND